MVLAVLLIPAFSVAQEQEPEPSPEPTQGLGDIQFDGISDSLADKIRPALSIARLTKSQRKKISAARLAFLVRRSEEELRLALMPLGYYDARITVTTEQTDNGTDVQVQVDAGAPTLVRELVLRIDGAAQSDRVVQRALSRFKPGVGKRFVDERYETGKRGISRALAERGYFDATLDQHEVRITRAEHAADIDLGWNSGPRYTLGPVRFEGSQLRTGLLAALTPWQVGDAYRQSELTTLQNRLVGLDYFAMVAVQPLPEQAQNGAVPVQAALTPAKRDVYSMGLSFGTDSGAGVRLGAERRWLNDRGHKLKAELDWAQRKRSFATQYRIPAFARFDGWYTLNANLREEDFGAFDNSRTIEVAANRNARFGDWGVTAGAWAQQQSFSAPDAPRTISTVWYPELSMQTVRARDPVNPRRGWSLSAKVRGNSSALGSDVSFLQGHVLAKWITPLANDTRLLLRGELGATRTNSLAALPPNLRFFAGGDQSIRGFGYNEVGVGINGVAALGGKHLAVASAEVDHYFGNRWGMAAFVDAGDAFNDPSAIALAVGAGLGLRWRSPVGPVRLDLAHGFNSQEQAWRIHLRIGPDL
jgi:translocation and assembly module TamA